MAASQFVGGLTPDEQANGGPPAGNISSMEVYRDSGEPAEFEPGIDTLADTAGPTTSIGYLTVTPSTSIQPLLIAGPGQSLRFHVRLTMSPAVLSSPVRDFFIEHVTDTTTGGTMVAHGGLTENFRPTPRNNIASGQRKSADQ